MEESVILDALAVLNSHHKLEDLIPAVLDISLQLTGAERAVLLLMGPDDQLTVRAARDRNGKALPENLFQGSTTVLRKVVQKKKPLYVPALKLTGEFAFSDSVSRWNLHSAVCVPLLHPKRNSPEVVGALYIDSQQAGSTMGERDLQLMQSLANHVAVSIENARLFGEIQRKNVEVQALNEQLQTRVETQAGNLAEMKMLLAETQRDLGRSYGSGSLVGRSAPMREMFRVLDKVTLTHATVLITGESGTGKELVARHIHYNGPRGSNPMVSINCSAFNETLLESELFGHVRGAFTGATESKSGMFQLASGGTLFLDEVGDMSSEMQKRLLRVLEDGEVRPVGSKEVNRVDVRIVAATNRDLQPMIRKGKFREDLYFRLNVISLHLPALRDRKEDIPLLVEFLSRRIAEELNRPAEAVPREVLRKFVEYDWPGNVRELVNELRRYFILESEYNLEQLQPERAPVVKDLKLSSAEKQAILKALKRAHGNKSKAARLLGIPRTSFYEKLEKLGIR